MSAEFSFSVDPARDLVKIRMAGFFSPADVAAFEEARAHAHRNLRCGPNQHVTLNDVRDIKILPQETLAAFQALLSEPHYRSRRLAFVVGATLARGQVKRATLHRNARLFETVADAEAWLLQADRAPTPREIRAA